MRLKMSDASTALRNALKKDARWKRFRAIVDQAYLPEFDAHIDEIERLHKTRGVRVLGAQAMPSGKRVADAAMRDQGVRSRCVEIVMQVTRSRNYLAIQMDVVRSYVMAQYMQLLGESGARTITEKKEHVTSMFSKADTTLHRLDTITEIADLVIKDCDQAAWALSKTVSALEVATKREHM
jgi:hypothetical protein